jgi:predicted transposase/invertase (TIGR01784 family)
MGDIVCIHNKIFKSSLIDIRVAQDFFEEYLPATIQELVDLSTLALEPGSYIEDERLKEFSSDVLYTVQLRTGEPAFFYILTEHQSTVDKSLALRLWNYKTKIWMQHVKQTKSFTLPFIFPLVLYHGEQIYDGARSLLEMIQGPTELIRDIFLKSFHLVDTHQIEDEALRLRRWSGVLIYMLKHVFEKDATPYFKQAIEMLRVLEREENATSYIKSLLQYWVKGAEIKNDPLIFIEAVKEGLSQPSLKEEIMTIADQLRQQGIQQGFMKGESCFFMNQLKVKFNEIPERYLSELERADTKTLEHWGINFINASSIDEVFRINY